MKKMIQFLYMVCVALLLAIAAGCSSTGYSGGSSHYHGSSSYYYGNSWGYDRHYRSGVNRHYNRSTARANVSRSGGGARSGGGGGRGGGGRR